MPFKNEQLLSDRVLSWNVRRGDVSSPTIMNILLVISIVRMFLVMEGMPFSMNHGIMPGLKHAMDRGAKQEMLGSASGRDKDHTCPRCDGSNVACELKSGRRSLWRRLGSIDVGGHQRITHGKWYSTVPD